MVIHTEALTRSFGSGKQTVEAVRGIDLDVARGRAGRLPRAQRGRQVHHPADADQPAAAHLGHGPGGRGGRHRGPGRGPRPDRLHRPEGRRRAQLPGLGRAAHAGPVLRPGPARRGRRAAHELLDTLDLAGLRDAQGEHPVRRAEAPAGHRAGPDPRAPRCCSWTSRRTGMDPQNRANLWEHIIRLRAERGTTIVLTTHYLEEADTMAERVVVIDHGRIIADDTAGRAQGRAGRRPDHRRWSHPATSAAARAVAGRVGSELQERRATRGSSCRSGSTSAAARCRRCCASWPTAGVAGARGHRCTNRRSTTSSST